MGKYLFAVVLLGALIGCGEVALPNPEPTFLVGDIILNGNVTIQDYFIRERLEFYPSQRISPLALRASEKRLAMVGIDARIIVEEPLDPDDPFKTIQVVVTETPWAQLAFRISHAFRSLNPLWEP
ncbi:MAG TPA: POTRA domain-containing protein [Gemmataceae bacterium]|nr:POTRA domain-containing protein [Gemmataceae bacterium]